MADFRKYVYALALVALLAGFTSQASAQQNFACIATATVPPPLRAEGMTELTGDIIIDCSGGIPTAQGSPIPQVNITVTINTELTSKITGTVSGANFSEAIIIIDQPNTPTWAAASPAFGGPRNILNCGNAGAPDTDPAKGRGICAIVAPGPSYATYDGTVNGQPGGLVCGGAGAPPLGSYGCGRPNVFQARQATLGSVPQQQIIFLDVPVDPPGNTGPGVPGVSVPPNCDAGGACHRILRITNIRADAASLGAGAGGPIFSGTPVLADLTVSNTTFLPLVNVNTLTIGRVNRSIAAPTAGTPNLTLVGCRDTYDVAGSVTFNELLPEAFKPRNISLLLSNRDNTNFTSLYALAPGIAADTAQAIYNAFDCRQNVPGATYNTEAAFQNSAAGSGGAGTVCPGGIPNPNPPIGFGTPVAPPVPNTAFSDNASGVGTQNAGVATNGTRLLVNIQNIFGAAGTVDVRVPGQVRLFNQGNGQPSGVAILQGYGVPCSPNVAGDNVFCPANAGYPAIGALPPPFCGGVGCPNDGYVSIGTFNSGLCISNFTVNPPVTVPSTACSSGRVFYEVVFSDPGAFETMTIPFKVDYRASVISLQPPVSPAPVAVANGFMGYAPHYALAAPQRNATTALLPTNGVGYPYPRFIDQSAGPFPLFSVSGKCTCNLLFPYVTDATLPGGAFDTGIAIANTSRDPGSVARTAGLAGGFGFNVGAQEQQGPVQFWYYSTQQAGGSPNFGNLGNGPQGNTQCTNVGVPGQCNDLNGLLTLNTGTNVPAGGVLGMSVKGGSGTWGLLGVDSFTPAGTFTGYIIAQASFQYCHAVAFTTSNGLAPISGLNIPSLGYVALTLDDNALSPRTSAHGEALGH